MAKGYKKGASAPTPPDSGIFNPLDYINQSDYKLNRRGQAQYSEDLAQLEYLAQMRQQEFQMHYQDPSSEVERMREAGLNPDLLGLSGATAPAGPTGTEGAKLSTLPNNLQQTSTVFGIVESVMSMTGNFMSGALNLSNMFLDNMSKEAQTLSSLIGVQDVSSYRNIDLGSLPLSRRTRKKLDKIPFSSRVGATQNYKGDKDFYDSGVSYMESKASHFSHVFDKRFNPSGKVHGDGSPFGGTLEEWADVWKPLADFAYKEYGHNQAAKYGKSLSDDEYFNTSRDGKTLGAFRADSEISQYNESDSESTFLNELRSPLRQVASNLKTKSDQGNSWATFALIALYMVSNLSFSRSSGPKGSSTSIGF